MAQKDTPISELIPTRLIKPWERLSIPSAAVHSKRFRSFYVILQLLVLFLGNAWLRLRGQKSSSLCERRTVKCLQRLGMAVDPRSASFFPARFSPVYLSLAAGGKNQSSHSSQPFSNLSSAFFWISMAFRKMLTTGHLFNIISFIILIEKEFISNPDIIQ